MNGARTDVATAARGAAVAAPLAGAAPPSLSVSLEPLGEWIASCLARFEHAADAQLPSSSVDPVRLHRAMRYAVLDGGKRIRPLLVYAAGEVSEAASRALDCVALAIEYVHAYSLVHDDLPCMDDDVLRRGKPTVHVAFDEATAMLAGDALQAEAFKVLSAAPVAAPVCVALVRELAQAASTAGMCGGQAIDLEAVGRTMSLEDLERMHRMKTGALLRASIRMGALAGKLHGSAAALDHLDQYASAIGLAFQVVDDILDVEASSSQLGKTAGKDARQNKPTYVSAVGIEAARHWAERLRQQAYGALDALDVAQGASQHAAACQSAGTARLRQLADLIVFRRN